MWNNEWLTPSQERGEAPGQRVEPDQGDDKAGTSFGRPSDRLKRLGDDNIAIYGDGQKVYHGGDSK